MIVSVAKASEAAEVLGVKLDGLTPNTLAKAYRAKTKECHPDYHGTEKLRMWSQISWANECLKRWIAAHPKQCEATELIKKGDCRACAGSGRVSVARPSGFHKAMTMACIICNGLGTIIPEENDHD